MKKDKCKLDISPLEEELYVPEIAEIVRVRKLTEFEKLFEIKLPGNRTLGHKPGQFVQVSIFGFGEAPISISSPPSKKDSFELCVRKTGSLTEKLHQMTEGQTVGIRGPFGNGFPIELMEAKDVIVIAGGIGLAPVRSVITEIISQRKMFGKMAVLYGTRSPADILFADELKTWSEDDKNKILLTVDKGDTGWKGNVGVVTTLFSKIQITPARTIVIACGPPVMYKFVYMELKGMGIQDANIFFSLERRMKCGIGKCGHCQLDDKYACIDGPVFSAGQVQSLHESIK